MGEAVGENNLKDGESQKPETTYADTEGREKRGGELEGSSKRY